MNTLKRLSITLIVLFVVAGGCMLQRVSASDFHFENIQIQDIKINNNANVQNDVTTTSNTGGNTTTTTGNSTTTVTTGNAGSQTTVTNCVNTTSVNGNANCGGTQPTNTPTPTPDPCVINPSSCATPTPGNGGGGGGSSSSNSSGGSSSSNGPTQAVLGASTMAGTGTFENSLMALLFALGVVLLAFGKYSFSLDKRK